jgi:hypothetical protein
MTKMSLFFGKTPASFYQATQYQSMTTIIFIQICTRTSKIASYSKGEVTDVILITYSKVALQLCVVNTTCRKIRFAWSPLKESRTLEKCQRNTRTFNIFTLFTFKPGEASRIIQHRILYIPSRLTQRVKEESGILNITKKLWMCIKSSHAIYYIFFSKFPMVV